MKLASLNRSFGDVKAVIDVSLDIAPGEFLTLLGPSGSGKTTTLMMIAGFDYPTSGEIIMNEAPIARLQPYERNIGMVFQSYALFPHMTVADNIGFPLKMRKRPRETIAASVARVLKVVNLTGYGERFPRQLSGGQQQRVALARAIVFDPPVLLMDEPLGALDKQLRARLQYEIKRIQQQIGITVVYVTHDQEEALVMSDRIGVMNHGRLLQVGSPTDLYDRPVNTFVASFIGETNFIPGRVEQIEADHAIIFAAGQRIVTRAPDDLDRGSAITLAVRPEKITLTKPDGPCPENYNKLAATVEQRFFIGESHRYGLLLADGSRIEVKQQNAADQAVLEPGDRADAIWHRDDLRVLRPEAEDRH